MDVLYINFQTKFLCTIIFFQPGLQFVRHWSATLTHPDFLSPCHFPKKSSYNKKDWKNKGNCKGIRYFALEGKS